jgi:hypothetical protein
MISAHLKGEVTALLSRTEIIKFFNRYDNIIEQIFPLIDIL